MTMTDPRLIRLAAEDNVLIVGAKLDAGARLRIDGEEIALDDRLSLGHKLASRPIAAGETVLKYNFPIGVATADIPLGGHVHVHNVRSAYTATHLVQDAETC